MRPDATKISLTDVVFPDRANHYGTLFGGHALHLMGKAAFIAATRHTRQHVVMASTDRITFAFKEANRPGILRIGDEFVHVVMPVNLSSG